MGRKQTAGSAGGSGVGGIQFQNTTLSAAANQDITIDPSGTGILQIAGDAQLQGQGDLRWADADSSNWVAFQAPATVSSNLTWTLPATDGSAAQVLTTNGSGTLSWSTAAVTISNETSDASLNYPTFTTTTTGTITAARVTSSKFTFQPSTGTLDIVGTITSLRTENVKTADHTLALADRDRVVAFNGTSTQVVTCPQDSVVAFPTGSVVYLARINTGAVSIVAGAGASVSQTGTLGSGEEIYVRKRAANTWQVVASATSLTATGGTLAIGAGFRTHTYTSAGSSETFVVG
jgi:hypothetical protein